MNTPLQQAPYLREQRQFPFEDLRELANQVDHAYIDIAAKVNKRTIGTYALNFPTITGDSWFLRGQPNKQQTLRQVYSFTSSAAIDHGINWSSVSLVSPLSYGSYTDGTNWYGIVFATSQPLANQTSFYVTPTQIVITVNGTAPAITQGYIVLEWLSQF